ncbi:MAG TPA: alpha-ketoglutarate-dependent dioxygenase AlkB [Caulobacteraceae bacterium]|jgi:alkylated DNA repair protein (DNA oxidative demethylase)|nr:alpha-ketoglutarate-dependent dioxygenase AlkB [Caulobacteraceae bacterium]
MAAAAPRPAYAPPSGFALYPGALTRAEQEALVAEVLAAADDAPFYRNSVRGAPMSVLNTNLGALGWIADDKGYRYVAAHPRTGRPWPDMPQSLLRLWNRYGDPGSVPDACLVNLYREGARLGLHQDRDEAGFAAPVLSVSLGDTALFRLGGTRRSDPTRSLRLASGDICVLAGEARLAFHGVDRIIPASSSLIPGGGRLNLTLRRAA